MDTCMWCGNPCRSISGISGDPVCHRCLRIEGAYMGADNPKVIGLDHFVEAAMNMGIRAAKTAMRRGEIEEC